MFCIPTANVPDAPAFSIDATTVGNVGKCGVVSFSISLKLCLKALLTLSILNFTARDKT